MSTKSTEIYYIFLNGNVGIQENNIKEICRGIRASNAARQSEWIENDKILDHYNENPFVVASLKLSKDGDHVEYVEFEELEKKGRA